MSRKLISLLLQPEKQLELELSCGCQNNSVAGGLHQYIITWSEALHGQVDEALSRRLLRIQEAFLPYSDLTSEARTELCQRTLKAVRLYAQQLSSTSPELTPESPLTKLPGIGPRRAELFSGLGIFTVADLLRHYPFRYDDRRQLSAFSDLQHDEFASLIVTVTGVGVNKRPRGHVLSHVPATDSVTEVTLVWFNQSWRATQFATGTELFIIGQMKVRKQGLEFVVSETEAIDSTQQTPSLNSGRITPVYKLVKGLNQGLVRRLTFYALEHCTALPESFVPEEICTTRNFMPWPEALQQIHYPESDELLADARSRIAYEEFFCLQVVVAQKRKTTTRYCEAAAITTVSIYEQLCEYLPFTPTAAQTQVCEEIAHDLQAPQCANRLIHGDVGSGKTVCAAYALAVAACAGRQAAIMAPTELLAQQHYTTLQKMLAPLGISPILLTGSDPSAQREAALQVQNGAAVVVGTHALFQSSIQFTDLAVVIIDEQHRFGVNQRAKLVNKGEAVNVFIMSATPIPRTLALTAYGDYDVSVMNELPPGRQPVKTEVLWGKDRKRAYETLSGLVAQGHQGYVICPLVDPTDNKYIAAAEKLYDRLRLGDFASFKIGLVHGRTEPTKREETMQLFSAGHLQILVATTIVEVGVDVPNATVMLVENAERFGLAQLHQLRGRVARGQKRGKCIMLTRTQNPDTINRLRVLERISNGFLIAEEDLKQRGPGEMTGMRQSGLPDLRMANLLADTATLTLAREDAFKLSEVQLNDIIVQLKLTSDNDWVL